MGKFSVFLGFVGGRDSWPAGYRLVREVGMGGMGVVYEAVDELLDRRVAIKRIRPGSAAAPEARAKLLEEARVVAALKHPNIVEIHAAIEHGRDLFLVFEYVDGKTLDVVMDPERPLFPEQAVDLLKQIAEALDYAHVQGVIHRDLKPSNIMVAGGRVKIMDFGIARRSQDLAVAAQAKAEEGTLPYMAPEQERGEYSKESDVYALGVCCYEMFAGRRPFARSDGYQDKIERSFRPVTALAPNLPRALDEALSKALSPEPQRRYASARAFASQVEKAFLER